jgi:pimeloyl-ACP methyl ester carboxylesterase
MNRFVALVAALITVGSLFLATQNQGFSRVDAGGPKLRLLLAGSGSPAVVFDAGGGGSLELWGSVPSTVGRFTTSVAYDRAGNGLSDRATAPRDARTIAAELHTALHQTSVKPPYVMVGHSLGGPHIRVFADMYPEEVAGLVLVDPTQEELFEWSRDKGETVDTQPCTAAGGERSCIAETLAQANASSVPSNIPVSMIHVMWPWPHGPFSVSGMEDSVKAYLPRIPLRLKFHKEWIENLPGGNLIITENSSHGGINLEEPELVVRTIRDVVEKARLK